MKDGFAIGSVLCGAIGFGMIYLPLSFIFVSIALGVGARNMIQAEKETEK